MAIAAGGRLFAAAALAVSAGKALSRLGHARCDCLSPMPTPTAHDRLFRCVFAEPEHAAGLLRSVLPGEISAQIEWPSLETVPGSVIDPELSDVCVDLLFSVKLDRREAYVYVLLEHQSWVRTLLRLLAAENGVQAAGTLVSYIEAVTNAPPGAVRELSGDSGPKARRRT